MSLLTAVDGLDGERRAEESTSALYQLGAYEHMWLNRYATCSYMADIFRKNPELTPLDITPSKKAYHSYKKVQSIYNALDVGPVHICLRKETSYPVNLQQSMHPMEILHYQGCWDLLQRPTVSIIGSVDRNNTHEWTGYLYPLIDWVASSSLTPVLGLDTHFDYACHQRFLEAGIQTIGFMGTPLSSQDRRVDKDLQATLSHDHLLLSQVPICRYYKYTTIDNDEWALNARAALGSLADITIVVVGKEFTLRMSKQIREAQYAGRKVLLFYPLGPQPYKFSFLEEQAYRLEKIEDIQKYL